MLPLQQARDRVRVRDQHISTACEQKSKSCVNLVKQDDGCTQEMEPPVSNGAGLKR
jgi:hypothetical protein